MNHFKALLLTLLFFLPLILCAQEMPENQENTDTVFSFYPMILVEGGTFQKGKDDSGAWKDEEPVFPITLDSYYIGKYEVTQSLYTLVAKKDPEMGKFKGHDIPVRVRWIDAVAFCNAMSRFEGLEPCYRINADTVYSFTPGLFPTVTIETPNVWEVKLNMEANGYRLPTEAEWEFAARGGNQSKGYAFSGSNYIDSVAWYHGNANQKGYQPVGTKLPNELGIYDMSGNVKELCWGEPNHCDSTYTVSTTASQDAGPARVRLGEVYGYMYSSRGGSVYDFERECRNIYRDCRSGSGMRLVRKKE